MIPAQGKVIVPTDLSIAVPEGCYGRIAPRSGLASKHFLDTGAGVIDADYRGPVGVLMFNFATTDYEGKEKTQVQKCHEFMNVFFLVKQGDRIAQLILERIYTPEVVEVNVRMDIRLTAGTLIECICGGFNLLGVG